MPSPAPISPLLDFTPSPSSPLFRSTYVELPPLLRYYSQKYPDLRFRLDANQSWPVHALNEFPELFEHSPIEYVEEPNNSMKSGVRPPRSEERRVGKAWSDQGGREDEEEKDKR